MGVKCSNSKMQNEILKLLLHTPSKLAELDTTILRYNREYPNVGLPISQATEFACPPSFWRDHRLGEVVADAKTKQDGSFKIEGVDEGTYNLVAEKAGFGWKYAYNIIINSKYIFAIITSR